MDRKSFLNSLGTFASTLCSGSSLYGLPSASREFFDKRWPDIAVLEWKKDEDWVAVLGIKNIGHERRIDALNDVEIPSLIGVVPNDQKALLQIHELARHSGTAKFRISDGSRSKYMFDGVVMSGAIGDPGEGIVDVRISVETKASLTTLVLN